MSTAVYEFNDGSRVKDFVDLGFKTLSKERQKDFADVVFEVGLRRRGGIVDHNAPTKEFFCVAALFAVHSSVFESMLYGRLAESMAAVSSSDDEEEEKETKEEEKEKDEKKQVKIQVKESDEDTPALDILAGLESLSSEHSSSELNDEMNQDDIKADEYDSDYSNSDAMSSSIPEIIQVKKSQKRRRKKLKRVRIEDVSCDAFQFLVDFLYGLNPSLTDNIVANVLYLSHKYLIVPLQLAAVEYIWMRCNDTDNEKEYYDRKRGMPFQWDKEAAASSESSYARGSSSKSKSKLITQAGGVCFLFSVMHELYLDFGVSSVIDALLNKCDRLLSCHCLSYLNPFFQANMNDDGNQMDDDDDDMVAVPLSHPLLLSNAFIALMSMPMTLFRKVISHDQVAADEELIYKCVEMWITYHTLLYRYSVWNVLVKGADLMDVEDRASQLKELGFHSDTDAPLSLSSNMKIGSKYLCCRNLDTAEGLDQVKWLSYREMCERTRVYFAEELLLPTVDISSTFQSAVDSRRLREVFSDSMKRVSELGYTTMSKPSKTARLDIQGCLEILATLRNKDKVEISPTDRGILHLIGLKPSDLIRQLRMMRPFQREHVFGEEETAREQDEKQEMLDDHGGGDEGREMKKEEKNNEDELKEERIFVPSIYGMKPSDLTTTPINPDGLAPNKLLDSSTTDIIDSQDAEVTSGDGGGSAGLSSSFADDSMDQVILIKLSTPSIEERAKELAALDHGLLRLLSDGSEFDQFRNVMKYFLNGDKESSHLSVIRLNRLSESYFVMKILPLKLVHSPVVSLILKLFSSRKMNVMYSSMHWLSMRNAELFEPDSSLSLKMNSPLLLSDDGGMIKFQDTDSDLPLMKPYALSELVRSECIKELSKLGVNCRQRNGYVHLDVFNHTTLKDVDLKMSRDFRSVKRTSLGQFAPLSRPIPLMLSSSLGFDDGCVFRWSVAISDRKQRGPVSLGIVGGDPRVCQLSGASVWSEEIQAAYVLYSDQSRANPVDGIYLSQRGCSALLFETMADIIKHGSVVELELDTVKYELSFTVDSQKVQSIPVQSGFRYYPLIDIFHSDACFAVL